MFSVSPALDTKALEQIFRHKVLKMLLTKEKITRDMITLLDKWRYTGFNVFSGPRILPRNEKSMENLARYIIRASFSQERMAYHLETGQVEYRSKDGTEKKLFDALKWPRQWAGCKHSRPCAVTCPTRASRWLVITVIIAMWRGENEKRLTIRFHASWYRS